MPIFYGVDKYRNRDQEQRKKNTRVKKYTKKMNDVLVDISNRKKILKTNGNISNRRRKELTIHNFYDRKYVDSLINKINRNSL